MNFIFLINLFGDKNNTQMSKFYDTYINNDNYLETKGVYVSNIPSVVVSVSLRSDSRWRTLPSYVWRTICSAGRTR